MSRRGRARGQGSRTKVGSAMIDAEVVRLRRLRNTALNARGLSAMLEPSGSARESVFARSAVRCWQIARVITGHLRAHPYLNYQRGPGELRHVYGGIRATLLSSGARYGGGSLRTLANDLQNVARELDDARALTWSADLSDTFGRSQAQIRRLLAEIDALIPERAGLHQSARSAGAAQAATRAAADGKNDLAGNWPYLAF
jgi:hypothetical protein